jgi:MFS family permease
MTITPVVSFLVAPFSGRLNDRIGPRFGGTAGALSFAVGLFLLAQLGGEASLADVIWRAAFIGLGMGLAMPTLSAASMASLPPQVRGVGSGALNTMRQIGFTVGVALLVAVFTHTVATNAQHATKQAAGVIAAQPDLSKAQKGAYIATLVKNAKTAAGNSSASQMTTEPLEGAPAVPGSSPSTIEELNGILAAIYRADIAKSFTWPFYAASLAALLAMIPALLTGRRLGEHQGHDEMNRGERLAAAGRAEADAAGEPLSEAATWERDGDAGRLEQQRGGT